MTVYRQALNSPEMETERRSSHGGFNDGFRFTLCHGGCRGGFGFAGQIVFFFSNRRLSPFHSTFTFKVELNSGASR
jgi:hypothetical protein